MITIISSIIIALAIYLGLREINIKQEVTFRNTGDLGNLEVKQVDNFVSNGAFSVEKGGQGNYTNCTAEGNTEKIKQEDI